MSAIEMPSDARQSSIQVEPGTLQALSLEFIKSPDPICHAAKLLETFAEFIQSPDDATARGAKYIGFFLEREMFSLYQRFVCLQTTVLHVLQQPPFSIPVESLTTRGIVLHHVAWQQLKQQDEAVYQNILTELDYIVIVVDEFFRSFAHVFFDPVSTCFFIAVHVLGKPRLDKTPLLFHTLKNIAQVRRARARAHAFPRVTRRESQDFRRLYVAIRGMSDFLYAHANVADLPGDIRGMLTPASDESVEKLLVREAPQCIQEFILESQFNSKSMRVTRFETLVSRLSSGDRWGGRLTCGCAQINNMNKTYDLKTRGSRAEELFGVMQQSVNVLRNMTQQHRLYPVLCNSSSDQDELRTLFERIRTCTTLG